MSKAEKIKKVLLEIADTGKDPSGKEYRLLTITKTRELAEQFDLSRREVELAALKAGVIPDRYQRSVGTIGLEGQIRLLAAKVGVVGAGGLGGFVVELLARMGIGKLVVIDGDSFADSNLNRQLLSDEMSIGHSKADAAQKRVSLVNGSTAIEVHNLIGDIKNLPVLLNGCDLVIDCLDNLPSRFDLEKVCGQLDIVMIHGAIAGFLGQLAVIRPGKPLLEAIYGPLIEGGATRGIEVQLGNPAATPCMLASWETSEAVKIIAGLEGVLAENKLLIIDMQSAESYQVEVKA